MRPLLSFTVGFVTVRL